MIEITNPSTRVYWIADNGTSFFTGVTEPNQQTSFGTNTGIYWQGDSRTEYDLKCTLLNIKPYDYIDMGEMI